MKIIKSKTLALYDVLKKYSDEKHLLSANEIINRLASEHGLQMERRTFYQQIDLLRNSGIDIETYQDNRKGYRLITRQYEKAEIHLLVSTIHSSHFIPSNYSDDLINRLLSTQSVYFKKNFKRSIFMKNDAKSDNKQLFLVVEDLLNAIADQKTCTFDYYRYNTSKKLEKRKEEPYLVHPYHIVFANENYYLICKTKDYVDMNHYRIDKIQNLQVNDQSARPLDKSFDPYLYIQNKVYMYGGEEENAHFRCHNAILDDMIDRFGQRAVVAKFDDDHFDMHIRGSRQGLIYLALQYVKYCEIVGPSNIRRDVSQILEESLTKYQ